MEVSTFLRKDFKIYSKKRCSIEDEILPNLIKEN